jgi:hypothetical protein
MGGPVDAWKAEWKNGWSDDKGWIGRWTVD